MKTFKLCKISAILVFTGLLSGCATLSIDQPKSHSTAITNIEIRIFNPVSRSGIYALNFIGQFSQANRRMHNKSFTVDNSISVVGGRNIADEYFQLKKDAVFVDFDILAVGPIAADISKSFDQYWNHSRAVPIGQFIKAKKKKIWKPFGKKSQKNSMASMIRYTNKHSAASC